MYNVMVGGKKFTGIRTRIRTEAIATYHWGNLESDPIFSSLLYDSKNKAHITTNYNKSVLREHQVKYCFSRYSKHLSVLLKMWCLKLNP